MNRLNGPSRSGSRDGDGDGKVGDGGDGGDDDDSSPRRTITVIPATLGVTRGNLRETDVPLSSSSVNATISLDESSRFSHNRRAMRAFQRVPPSCLRSAGRRSGRPLCDG
jgi:hypothetical protein